MGKQIAENLGFSEKSVRSSWRLLGAWGKMERASCSFFPLDLWAGLSGILGLQKETYQTHFIKAQIIYLSYPLICWASNLCGLAKSIYMHLKYPKPKGLRTKISHTHVVKKKIRNPNLGKVKTFRCLNNY